HVLRDHLRTRTTDAWLAMLEPADIWCAPVQDYRALVDHAAFAALDMTQRIVTNGGAAVTTLRCPIRIDGAVLKSTRAAPPLGEHTAQIADAFGLDAQAAQIHDTTETAR